MGRNAKNKTRTSIEDSYTDTPLVYGSRKTTYIGSSLQRPARLHQLA